MRQPVHVAFRVRNVPADTEDCLTLDEKRGTVSICGTDTYPAMHSRQYHGDTLLGKQLSNRDVFEKLLLPRLNAASAEHPQTVCFLAYGHTNSGKTHTIIGNNHEDGILTRCVEELILKNGVVEVSMIEMYMEAVYDLLDKGKLRKIRRHHSSQGTAIVVENLFTCSIISRTQWEMVAQYGVDSRRTAATDQNSRSSRSHAICTLKSKGVRVCFVDLAGSERQTVFSPKLNKESISINKSLSRLSTVLQALSVRQSHEDARRSYVNFRDTLLTVLLQPYLSGASLVTFLACVHPSAQFYPETLSTLRYAQRLKRIHTLVPQSGGPGDVSSIADNQYQAIAAELMQLRQQVKQERKNAQLIIQSHLLHIANLEYEIEERRRRKSPRTRSDSSEANVMANNLNHSKFLKVRDTKRVVGWLIRRTLGSLPPINVGYDEYFDPFVPPQVQVIGYVSIMACLAPRTRAVSELAFLDVGDLSMGLSMVDASIPPFVRLHRVPCHQTMGWDGEELDAHGHLLYTLAFFEVNEGAMARITERDDNQLECCKGYLSLESLLPIALVLCLPTSSPLHVKENVLQWLITLQDRSMRKSIFHIDCCNGSRHLSLSPPVVSPPCKSEDTHTVGKKNRLQI